MSRRGLILRGAYLAGVCATLAIGASAGALLALFGFPDAMRAAVVPSMMVGFAAIAIPMLFLTFRPYWWGKLFTLWPALSWMGFTGAMSFIVGWNDILWTPMLCGVAMLLTAIIHQVVDPRFSGPPLN